VNSSPTLLTSSISSLFVLALGVFSVACGESTQPDEADAPQNGESTEAGGGSDRPNLILITIDSCRPDRTSAYGYEQATTPNLAALAAEGMLFEQAFTVMPMALPAHATMLTGLLPQEHGVRDDYETSLDQSWKTLPLRLSHQNYQTGAFVGSLGLHLKYGLNLGFARYDDGMERTVQVGLDPARRSGSEVVRLAGEWLSETEPNQPVFMLVNLSETRAPRTAPADGSFADGYDAQLHAADEALGQLLAKLRELGRYDNSMIVVTSGNGEAFGEHGETGHGYLVHNATTRIPLIMRVPGGGSSQRIESPASLIDIAPTFLTASGTPFTDMKGVNLPALASSPQLYREIYSESILPTRYEFSAQFSLQAAGWKYIHSTEPELYNIAQDPEESVNLVASEGERAAALRTKLESLQIGKNLSGKAPIGFLDEHQLISSFPSFLANKDVDSVLSACDKIDEEHGILRVSAYWRMMAEILTFSVERSEKMVAHLKSFLAIYPARRKPAKARLEPFSSSACFQLGLQLVETGQGSFAIFPLRDALRSRPREVTGQLALGEAFLQIDRQTQAVRALEVASTIETTADLQNTIGSVYARNDGYLESLPYFEKAVELAPDNSIYQANLGRTYVAHRDWAKAVVAYRASLEINPAQPEIEMELAYFLATTDDDAVKDVKSAVEGVGRALNGGIPISLKILDGMSTIYLAAGQYDLAVKFMGRALDLAREGGDTREVLQFQQQYSEAIRIANEFGGASEEPGTTEQ
jgi:tetratricopeptide (TPR) repeat protein